MHATLMSNWILTAIGAACIYAGRPTPSNFCKHGQGLPITLLVIGIIAVMSAAL